MKSPTRTHHKKSVARFKKVSSTEKPQFLTHLRKLGTRGILSAIFLFLLIVGGAAAFFLSQTNLDLRQQAGGTPGLYAHCSGFAKEGETYCGSTAPGTCLKCVNGIGQQAGDNECAGKPCDPGSIFNVVNCNGAKEGETACVDTEPGSCRICKAWVPAPGRSPIGRWVKTNDAVCAGKPCGAVPLR